LQSELPFSEMPVSDRLSPQVLSWLARSFETMEEWKAKAAVVFFASNGDSAVSRNRVAAVVRNYFVNESLKAEEVKQWQKDCEQVEVVEIVPPKVSASNSTYVDWLFVADYLLLACGSTAEALLEENQRRESECQTLEGSYKIRLIVHEAREVMRGKSDMSDDDVLLEVQGKHKKAALANVKEARRQERANTYHAAPQAPIRPEPMPPYSALYF